MKHIKTAIGMLLLSTMIPHAQEMKCEPGKCGSAMVKDIPKQIETMKCEAGKCGGSKETVQKNSALRPSNIPTIKQLFNVKTIRVKELNTSKEQINYGYITAQDSALIDVTAWFSGYVEILHVDTLYEKVTKGQALASVYSPEVYKAKQDYLNSLRFSTKRPSVSMIQSARTKLVLLGVSETEIQEVKDKGKVSRLTTLYAPASGWIFEKNINQGSFINAQRSLYKITDLSTVWLEAKLFQNELAKLKTLQHFNISVKGVEKIFEAKKELLYPVLDPKEATATLRLSIDNPNEILKPGMYAKLHSSSPSETKLVIPRTAAIRKSSTWYVFLATEFKGEYEPIEVSIKPLDNAFYEVVQGLNNGDQIVNNALFMMDADAQINSIY